MPEAVVFHMSDVLWLLWCGHKHIKVKEQTRTTIKTEDIF